ncbi:MAG TPA: hypothetical protein VHA56_09245 [Mucilaginibacter sp.]|nr:hypothetical protein [Mucilaginibacter sp.]
MNKYPKTKSLRFIICFTLVVSALIIHACRKDVKNPLTQVPQKTDLISAASIDTLKTIYNNGIHSSYTVFNEPHGVINFINSLDVDWNTFTIQKRNGSIVTEFEIKSDTGLFVLKKMFVGDTVKYRNRTTVTFIKFKDGRRLNFFTKIIEDLSMEKRRPIIKQLHYGRIPSAFSGVILYYSLDRQFINGYRFKNGKPDGIVSFSENSGSQPKINSLQTDNMQASCTTYDVWETYCEWGGTVDDPYEYFHGCSERYLGYYTVCEEDDDTPVITGDNDGGGTTNPCSPNPGNVTVESVSHGKLVIDFIPPPTGDDGGGNSSGSTNPCPNDPPPATNQEFDNKIQDSLIHDCLEKIFQKIKEVKAGNFASIISKLSGSTPGYDWEVSEGALPPTAYGNTTYSKVTERATTIIDFNKLKNSTELAAATTMIHEAVHSFLAAYFRNDPVNFQKSYSEQIDAYMASQTENAAQHMLMATTFISDISAAIKSVAQELGYTSIDDQVFDDMAWSGLQGTDAYLSLSEADQIRIQNRISAEINNKSYGTEYPKGKNLGCN